MIAGTLGVLDPVDEKLDSWAQPGGYPAIEVRLSQSTHDESIPQSGAAAARVTQTVQTVDVVTDQHDDVHVDAGRDDEVRPFATDWVADVTGTGIVLAESVDDPDDELPFPFDLVSVRTGSEVERRAIDVATLHGDWDDAGDLSDVWMNSSDASRGTSINYHGAAASSSEPPTIGLGFKRPWGGTVIKGAVYEGGYVALFDAATPAQGLRFVAEELLPYTHYWDPEEQTDQTDFDEWGS